MADIRWKTEAALGGWIVVQEKEVIVKDQVQTHRHVHCDNLFRPVIYGSEVAADSVRDAKNLNEFGSIS